MHGRIYACMSPSKRAWALRAWAHGFNLPRVITYFGETKSSFQKSWILTPSSKVGDTPNALIMPRKVEIYSFEFVGLSVTLFFLPVSTLVGDLQYYAGFARALSRQSMDYKIFSLLHFLLITNLL